MIIDFIYPDETTINRRQKGKVYAVDIPRCCRIEDEELGIVIISKKQRSQLDNKELAISILNTWKEHYV